jgi:hypothetical protein
MANISNPPAEPRERKISPLPSPQMIPATIVATIRLWRMISGIFTHSAAIEKKTIPNIVRAKKRLPNRCQPSQIKGKFSKKYKKPRSTAGSK